MTTTNPTRRGNTIEYAGPAVPHDGPPPTAEQKALVERWYRAAVDRVTQPDAVWPKGKRASS